MAGRAKAPTILDIAAEAGVSKSAVSRALLGQGEVSEDTRRRVEDAAAKLGYVPNAMAAGLRSRTRTIGVVLRDLNRPYYGALHAAMQRQADRIGYRLVTATSSGELDVANAIGALRTLISLQVDGLVIASAQLNSDEVLPFVDRVPIVAAGRMEIGGQVPGVYCDDVDGGARLARRLLDAGHQRIAVAVVAEEYSLSQSIRGRAMVAEIEAAGRTADVFDIATDGEARSVASRVLDEGDVTALMCPTDVAVMDVLDELRVRGLNAPEALSVTGYDGIGELASPFLGLTTFRQPMEEIGARAITLLIEAIESADTEDRAMPDHEAIRGVIVDGRTVGALA